MSKVLTACLMLAAQTYSIPPAVLVGIYNVEGGKPGQQVSNTNGSYDLGPMQINTLWLPSLADYWGVPEATAKKWVRDDVCTNMGVSAWILRQHLNETGSLGQAIAHYHSRTPELGSKYRRKVVSAMEKQGLLRPAGASTGTGTPQVTVRATQSTSFGKQATRVAQMSTASSSQQQTVLAQQTATTTTPRATVGLPYRAEYDPHNSKYAARGMNTIVVYNPSSDGVR